MSRAVSSAASSAAVAEAIAALEGTAIPDEFVSALSGFATAVGTIEQLVQRLQQAPWHKLCSGLSPLESARLHLMVAYAVNTLFYMYLRTQGISPANHPVLGELARVKQYVRKVKQASAAEEHKEGQRQASINVEAAQRFITHALTDPTAVPASAAGTAATAGGDRTIEGNIGNDVGAAEETCLEGALSAERAEADGGALKSKLEALREAKAAGTEPADELAAALGPQVMRYAREVEEAHETNNEANESTSEIAPASARDKRRGGSSARSEGKKKSKLGVRR